jgi:hypothetical protein
MYLTKPSIRENLNFDIFCKKSLLEIKTAITFAYELKKSVIYEKLSRKKVTSDSHKFLLLKIPKETKKHEDFRFCQQKRKIIFFQFF